MSIGRAILKTGLVILRGIYGPMKLQPVRHKVTIISRQSDRPTTDIALLDDYLRKAHPDLQVVTLCRTLEGGSSIGYAFHMLRQMWHMASSSVVLIDGYCIAVSVLRHRPQTRVVQMWHALAAVKKFGWQAVGRPGGRSPEIAKIMNMHGNYDRILCPSMQVGRDFARAFGAGEEKLVLLGLPRIDGIMAGDEPLRSRLREEYRIPEDREILLYVPTFRPGERIPVRDLIGAVDPERFVLVIRLHPLYGEMEEIPGAGEMEEIPGTGEQGGPEDPPAVGEGTGQTCGAEPLRVIADENYSSYDWLHACDRVITDYSALSVEASLTGKPLYFYVYDIDRYEGQVGLNVDPREEMPKATARTGGELERILAADYDDGQRERFRNRYVTVDTDHCTEKLGEYIYGMGKEAH